MSLRDRIGTAPSGFVPIHPESAEVPATGTSSRAYQVVKRQIHQTVLRRLDIEALEQMSALQLKEDLRLLIERLLQEENLALNAAERRTLVRDLQDEITGYGPLEQLLHDASVSDILVNGHDTVYVERKGRLELTDVSFIDNDHLMKIIDKIVSAVGRRVDESSPMVDARLPDGSRFNAVIPPLALDGPIVSIRRFSTVPLQMHDLVERKTLSEDMALFLAALTAAKVNVLISGGTGSGKTTLLNIMSSYIPSYERVITIEDAAELRLQQPHVVRLETRPANVEGRGEISQRQLVKNALRMRPDRIILGETRGSEALDMLQAMNTGHEGSMTTIHANSPRDALGRLESMIAMAGVDLPAKAARAQMASAINVIVQANRLSDGTRKITSIQEVSGTEGEIVTLQELFVFRQTGVGPDGGVQGFFSATGVRSRLWERMTSRGARLPESLFNPTRQQV